LMMLFRQTGRVDHRPIGGQRHFSSIVTAASS
jgi:hypothetical protein